MSNRALNIVECIAATLLVVSATVLAILDEPTTPVVVSRVYQCPTCPYQWYTYYSTVTF